MPEQELYGGAPRAREDEFFHKRDRELVEKMRSQAEAGAALRELAGLSGITDDVLLRDLQGQGFSTQTFKLLDLTPLILVAWSNGSVTAEERNEIAQVARSHGVTAGSPGYGQLTGWLEARPSDEFFELTLRAIRTAWESIPAEKREDNERALVALCTQVAKASGGFLRWGSRISAAERLAIRQVAEQLGCVPEIAEGIEEAERL
jgi:hypothetical protein